MWHKDLESGSSNINSPCNYKLYYIILSEYISLLVQFHKIYKGSFKLTYLNLLC